MSDVHEGLLENILAFYFIFPVYLLFLNQIYPHNYPHAPVSPKVWNGILQLANIRVYVDGKENQFTQRHAVVNLVNDTYFVFILVVFFYLNSIHFGDCLWAILIPSGLNNLPDISEILLM